MTTYDREYEVVKEDAFDDASIDGAIWTTNTPVGSITETGGTLNFHIDSGVNGDWWTSTKNGPILYTPIPSGDFEFKAKLTSFGTAGNKMAGIMLYKDRNNAYKVGQGNNHVYVDKLINNVGTNLIGSISNTTVPVWFKIICEGTTASFYYSTDDSTYTLIYTVTREFTPTHIGIFAQNWSAYPTVDASFDDFIVTRPRVTFNITINDENYINWLWQNEITITGSPDGQLTDYPINITVPYDNEFMRTDFGDIRFGTDYGVNLSYFMRQKVDSDYAEFIVKIPIIPASPDTITIYLYAGNDQAQDRSNGFEVFDLFDDFNENYAVGIDTSKWIVTGGYSGIVDGILEVWSGYPLLHCQIHSVATFAENYIMGVKAQIPSVSGYASFGFDDGSNRYIKQYIDRTSSSLRCNDNGTEDTGDDVDTTYPTNEYHVYEFEHKQGLDIQGNIDFTKADDSPVNITTAIPVRFHAYGAGITQGIYVDYVYVRKSIANEPAIGELGTWATTTHTNIYKSSLVIPFYHDSQATICIRPLREDFKALINILGSGDELIQSLVNITGYSTHTCVNLIQSLVEINDNANNLDSQALIRIGNVYNGTLEIKGKVLYNESKSAIEEAVQGELNPIHSDNKQFVINLGGRIYG